MADTNTSVLDLLLMEIDSHENDWGDQTNANLSIIARAIGATVAHAVTTGTVTLTRDNVKDALHRVTGVLVGNVVIEVPATEPKTYFWTNETTGAFTVTVKVTGQTGVVLPRGETVLLRCNGTDVVSVPVAQGALSGTGNWVGTLGFAADAYTASLLPGISNTLVDGMEIEGLIANANTTATPTLAYGGGTAKTIVLRDASAVAIGEMQAGQMGRWKYRSASDKWHWMNPPEARTRGPAIFTKAFGHTVVTLTDAATIAWDLSTGTDFEVTITSNRTLGAFTGGTAGQEGTLRVKQDGTGGWSLNLGNAVYDYWGPSIEDIARGANDVTEYEYKVITANTAMVLKRKGATSIGGSGRDLLALATASNSAQIDFVLTKWLTLYDRFEVDIDALAPATDGVGLHMRTSTDGGSTFDSGASDYAWILDRLSNTVVDGQVDAAGSEIEIAPSNVNIGLSNAAGDTAAATINIHAPGSANKAIITWRIGLVPANPSFVMARYQGVGCRNNNADVDAVRFFCSSGNIASGAFRLYGVRK